MIYLRLFWEFFKTGLFAIGGGMATLPFLHDIGEATGLKDLFSSEQLNALKHRFPNISNAMNEGKELLKQNTPKLGGRGI